MNERGVWDGMTVYVVAIGLGLAAVVCLQLARYRARQAHRKHMAQLIEDVTTKPRPRLKNDWGNR